ncbi:MAG: hypothetical protein ACK5LN_06325 [Propioniciclava sp.]
MTQNLPLAVGLVIVGSFCFALSAHLQHGAVDASLAGNAEKKRMRLQDLLVAIRSPRWVMGLFFIGMSAVLQITALTMAPVSLVQPVGLLAFPWSVILAARATRTPITMRIGAAVGITVAATLAFTVVTGLHAVDTTELIVWRIVAGALVVYCVAAAFAVLGSRGSHGWRCLFWASGGALFYGLEAALVKTLIEYAAVNPWLTSPMFWGIGIALAAGALIAGWFIQQGYATGPPEVVVGSMTVTSPVVAVLYGIAVLGEGAGITLQAGVWMVILGAIAVGGVAALARFHPNYANALPVPGIDEVLPESGDAAPDPGRVG